jgi:ATP-dependent Zn protease
MLKINMKKILGIFFSIILFWISWAVDINMDVNPKESDINNPIQLKLEITTDQNANIELKWIKWLENFDIVWQRQFQSSSSQIKIINWKTESITKTTQTLILILQAKKAWTYTIWPAVLDIDWKTYKTKQIQVKITGAKIMIWNAQNSINQLQQANNNQVNQQWNSTPQANLNEDSNKDNDTNNTDNQKEIDTENNSNPWLLIIILINGIIILWIILLVYSLKNNKEEKQDINTETFTKNKKEVKQKESPLSFLEKYWIKNPETKSYSEIMEELKNNWIYLSNEELKTLEKELVDKFKN